jgi:hypothetical protein
MCVSDEEIRNLVDEFEKCTLPYSRWSHEAHLMVAFYYLSNFSYEEALDHMRNGIKKYIKANGIETTKDRGYHETITVFYMKNIFHYLEEINHYKLPRSMVIKRLIEIFGNKTFLAEYYSKDRLMSWEARINWVEPDLKRSS